MKWVNEEGNQYARNQSQVPGSVFENRTWKVTSIPYILGAVTTVLSRKNYLSALKKKVFLNLFFIQGLFILYH